MFFIRIFRFSTKPHVGKQWSVTEHFTADPMQKNLPYNQFVV